MVDANTEVLQAAAQANYNRDLNGALQIATGLNLDVNGICQRLFGRDINRCFTQLLQILSNHALLLPGLTSSFVSTPDAAALDIVGDIDLRIECVDFAVFSPETAVQLANRGYISKWTPAAQQSYRFSIIPVFVNFRTSWSTTGADSLAADNANATAANRTRGALRTTIDVDNGASGRTIRTFVASSIDGPWTQVGSDVVQGTVTSIFASTAALVVGANTSAGVEPFLGRITRAEIRAGIDGTVVANPDFRNLAPGTTSFADGTGKTWTLSGAAQVV